MSSAEQYERVEDGGPSAVDLYVEARKALFMCATSCQGGASDAGMAAAKVLGIPFPIKINNLVAQALKEGFDPFELWSWYPRASLKAIVAEVSL